MDLNLILIIIKQNIYNNINKIKIPYINNRYYKI